MLSYIFGGFSAPYELAWLFCGLWQGNSSRWEHKVKEAACDIAMESRRKRDFQILWTSEQMVS